MTAIPPVNPFSALIRSLRLPPKHQIQAIFDQVEARFRAAEGRILPPVAPFALEPGAEYSQAEMAQVVSKLNELIGALAVSGLMAPPEEPEIP